MKFQETPQAPEIPQSVELSQEDIAKIKKFKHLDFLGVNINSRFEKEHGVKDMGKVLAFVQGTK